MEEETGGVSYALTEDDIKKIHRASNTRKEAIKIIIKVRPTPQSEFLFKAHSLSIGVVDESLLFKNW